MSTRSRSRSPRANTPDGDQSTHSRASVNKSDQFVTLIFENFPKTWSHYDVKDFIRQKTLPKDLSGKIQFVKMHDKRWGQGQGTCSVLFVSHEACRAALDALSGVSHEGTLIHIKPDYDFQPKPKKQNYQGKPVYKPRVEFKAKSDFRPNQKFHNRQDYWDDQETYGLSKKYLSSLDIKPPLINKIFIANLDMHVTESKLREIFGHAGHIMCVSVIEKKNSENKHNMAKVEFDHPVEAVQAISMFHNQELYDRPMVVLMDHHKNSHRQMPTGLKGFGPGLGRNGEPLRGIRNSVELQPFKQYLTQEIEKMKKTQEDKKDSNMGQSNNPLSSLLALNSILNPQGLQQLQGLQTLLNQGSNNSDALAVLQPQNSGVQNQNAAFQNPNPAFQNQNQAFQNQNPAYQNQSAAFQNQNTGFQGQNAGYQNQNPAFQNQAAGFQNQISGFQSQGAEFQSQNPSFQNQNMGANVASFWQGQPDASKQIQPNQGAWLDSSDTNNYGAFNLEDHQTPNTSFDDPNKAMKREMLMFNNLPPNVTSSALVAKMREVGELKFAEMTGQGRAIVRFTHVEDSLRCIKLFDQSKVDGQIIEVKFF